MGTSEITGEKAGRRMSSGMMGRLSGALDTLKEVMGWASYEDAEDDDEEDDDGEEATKGFSVIKTEDGYRWVAVSSSAFVDRENEIVSTKALTDDVARTDRTGNPGPLILWHTPGTEIGDCDFRAVEGRLLIESGTFRETEFATTVRKALMASPDPLGVSIGFRHTLDQPDAHGVFHSIATHERSVCPLEVAANPFTSFETLKESSYMDDKRKAWFASLVGEERADKIVGIAAQKSKDLEGLFAFKAVEAMKTEPDDPPPPDDGDGDDGDGDGGDDRALAEKAGEFFEAIAETVNDAISPAVAAVKAQDQVLAALATQMKTLTDRMDALEAAKTPEPVEERKTVSPASRAREALKQRATEDDSNVIDDEKVRELFASVGKTTEEQPTNPARPYIDDLIRSGGRGA